MGEKKEKKEYLYSTTFPSGKKIYSATFRFLGPLTIIGGIVVALRENFVPGLFLIVLGLAFTAFGFAKVKKKSSLA
ncbi:MAG: hypothetical protein ABIH34_00935 [Nanoarchaeota archaeon]